MLNEMRPKRGFHTPVNLAHRISDSYHTVLYVSPSYLYSIYIVFALLDILIHCEEIQQDIKENFFSPSSLKNIHLGLAG